MSFGFIIDNIDSTKYGLSLMEVVPVAVGQSITKNYYPAPGVLVTTNVIAGDFAANVVPVVPVVTITGSSVDINGTSSNVAVNVIVLCQ